MEVAAKKSTKKTTSEQFGVLVQEMEANLELARGVPVFGASRTKVDHKWSLIAAKVNSYGPPNRSVTEWRKIWADLKSRTKKKISENHKSIRETGGGPFRYNPLTEMEQTIDRILLISTAADPRGRDLGVLPDLPSAQSCEQSADFVAIVTPPRRVHPVGIVTPTRATSSTFVQHGETSASHPKPMKRKKNMMEEQVKLIRLELQNQKESIEEMRNQNVIAQAQAESIKMMAEAAKTQAEATKDIAEATATQAEAVKNIAVAVGEILSLLTNK